MSVTNYYWHFSSSRRELALGADAGCLVLSWNYSKSTPCLVRQASAQEAGSSAQQREMAGNGYAYLHLAVEYHDVLAFLPHFLL